MTETTLCYLEKDGCYLLLHRVKKKQDINEGKWIGVGGKREPGESPEDCARREIREETGLTVQELRFRAVITFLSDEWGEEMMYLFTSRQFTGELAECDEGELAWVPVEEAEQLPTWEGDRIFLQRLREREDFFSLKLVYHGEELVQAVLWEAGRERILRCQR
ncbi:MAG: 8-oxo-dGTP diphosphatase [Lachnospiraceae bacterium]|nr:8-oxo-dGTP diphosphatase [Lachnospiraceae bacterium]